MTPPTSPTRSFLSPVQDPELPPGNPPDPVTGDVLGSMEWQDWLEDESADHAADFENKDEVEFRLDLLRKAMSFLNDREQDILHKRRLQDTPSTLEELSSEYGVSKERIRQIEVRAFEKLQMQMRELASEVSLVS